jgi:hypothetical protein
MAANQTLGAGGAPKVRGRSRWGRRLLFVIVLFAVAGFVMTRYAMQRQGPPRSVFQATLEQSYPNIAKAMDTVAMRTPNGAAMTASQLMSAAAISGFRSLDDQSLMNFTVLRSELALQSDVATCAGLWSGNPQNLVPAIEALPDDQQRQWAELFDRAAVATINRAPSPPAPSPAAFQQAMNRAVGGMSSSDAQLLNSVLEDPQHQAPADQCAAARALYAAIEHANHDDAVTITRGMLYQ